MFEKLLFLPLHSQAHDCTNPVHLHSLSFKQGGMVATQNNKKMKLIGQTKKKIV